MALILSLTTVIFLPIEIKNKFTIDYVKDSLFCKKKSQFISDSEKITYSKENIVSENNQINHLYENFSKYLNIYSKSIEEFEDFHTIESNQDTTVFKLSKEKYSGEYSVELPIQFNTESPIVQIKKRLNSPVDISRWSDAGFISFWLKIEDRKGIDAVSLTLYDKDGNKREYNELSNLQTDLPNFYDRDDPFPDFSYPNQKNNSDQWTDFWLNKGWNFLFWQIKENNYKDSGIVDIKNITHVQINIKTLDTLISQKIILDNLRIEDGLQKEKNSTNGEWYPPLGRPQYGIFDIDNYDGKSTLKLLNVRQSQYPSNGDHGRIVSKNNAPENFSMRTRFIFTDLPKTKKEVQNTWFRVMYDFDPEYDPGHDWFGVYMSLEWNRFGLLTVEPLDRFKLQRQEPLNENINDSGVDFTPKENVPYEIDLTVRGQVATATIYSTDGECLNSLESVSYTFNRPRYGEEKRYPFAFEITGNIKVLINEIEINKI